jgi:hypothetical protein
MAGKCAINRLLFTDVEKAAIISRRTCLTGVMILHYSPMAEKGQTHNKQKNCKILELKFIQEKSYGWKEAVHNWKGSF